MRRFLSAFCLFLGTHSLADNPPDSKTRYYRHEVNVSIGGVRVRTGWSNDYERSVMIHFGLFVGKVGDGKVVYESSDSPDLGNHNALKVLSYYYHLNYHMAIGGLLGGCSISD